jgi:hypothetical protein
MTGVVTSVPRRSNNVEDYSAISKRLRMASWDEPVVEGKDCWHERVCGLSGLATEM